MNGGISILSRVLCLALNVIIAFALPVGLLLALKKPKEQTTRFFMAGCAAFIVSQVFLRIPILTFVLPHMSWYNAMQFNPWFYGFFLGLSAGIFEEGARWIVLRHLLKRRFSPNDLNAISTTKYTSTENRFALRQGLAFGLGHGGVEAMIFVGLNSMALLVLYPLGSVDLGAQAPLAIAIAGVERLFAMAFHVGASLVVLYGLRVQKALRYTCITVALHTIINAMVVILPSAFDVNLLALEIVIGLFGLATLAVGIRLNLGEKQ